MFIFFFFQAEDGIRDLTVTGVQTCALPIYGEGRSRQTGQPVLAAQILAIGGEKQLAGVDQAKALAIAVMRRRDPLLAFVLGTFASNRRRAAPKDAVRTDLHGG